MNRRSWLGIVAGLFGLSAAKGHAEDVIWPVGAGSGCDDINPLVTRLPASEWTPMQVWHCTNQMRLLESADGMTAQLQQMWVCYPPGEPMIEEWRPIEIVCETTVGGKSRLTVIR